MKVKQVLELSPQEASEWMHAGSLDAHVVVGVEASADVIHIAFKNKNDKQVYIMIIKGDNRWLSEFLSAPTSTFESHITNDIRAFADAGLKFWPAEQAFLRMRAILDFRNLNNEPNRA
jgi:hypothetical protein